MKKILLLSLILGMLAACSPAAPQQQSLLPPTFTVDATLTPPVTELPGFSPGQTRPVATVTGPDDITANFMANEVWLSNPSQSELDAFLDRWQGEILQTFDAAANGLSGIGPQYLIRVEASDADATKLGENLRKLDPETTGDNRVSSQAGLDLIAVSAEEAAGGLEVGMNWLGDGAQIRNKTTTEAPTGGSLAGVAYDPNAFTWPSHSAGSTLDIGVAEAWRMLDLADKLDNTVTIAILDMGFQPDADFPAGWQAISNVPALNPVGTENLLFCEFLEFGSCPWHGTSVSSAAFAVPDNDYGSAGSAGPIAEAILIFTLYDMFTSITALGQAKAAGADIANMSYGTPVPDVLFHTVLPFEAVTAAFRASGMLLFAAAGNDKKNVDAERCIPVLGCLGWEKTWYTPCENAGVICVGGTEGNSKGKAEGSNYGAEQVDIFAPFTLWLGPNPGAPGNEVRVSHGTSYSAPFAAGVAALIWAADPFLSASEVEDILMDTAHSSPDEKVNRYVNALGAVQAALGNTSPSITLFGHDDGDTLERNLNIPLNLSATVEDFEDGNNCCTLEWTSSVDGDLGTGPAIQPVFTTTGSRVITVAAQDSGGASSSVSVTVNVTNTAPTVAITKPIAGEEVFATVLTLFSATSNDINEPDLELACGSLVWTSSLASDPFPLTGCDVEAIFSTNGARTITLTGTDPQGLTGTASVTFSVIDPPVNLPPSVRITSPANGGPINQSEAMTLSGTATDSENDVPLAYVWTASLDDGAPVVVGNAATVTWTPADTFTFGTGRTVLEITLSVTDAADNTGSDFVVLESIFID